jgi:hypothetical protein
MSPPMALLHRWASGGSGGSSRVSAWSLKPAAAAAAKSRAMMIQVIGRFSYAPRPAWSGTYYGNRAAGQSSDLLHAMQFRPAPPTTGQPRVASPVAFSEVTVTVRCIPLTGPPSC